MSHQAGKGTSDLLGNVQCILCESLHELAADDSMVLRAYLASERN